MAGGRKCGNAGARSSRRGGSRSIKFRSSDPLSSPDAEIHAHGRFSLPSRSINNDSTTIPGSRNRFGRLGGKAIRYDYPSADFKEFLLSGPQNFGEVEADEEHLTFDFDNDQEGTPSNAEKSLHVESQHDHDGFGTSSRPSNPGYLAIGGMNLYTQDVPGSETEEREEEEDDDAVSDDSESSSENFPLTHGDSDSDSASDIDEELAKDYLEGIGGSDMLSDVKWLLNKIPDFSDKDGDESDSSLDKCNVKKLEKMSIQEASRMCGMKPRRSRKKRSPRLQKLRAVPDDPDDDLTLIKDPRPRSTKDKRVKGIHHSWPFARKPHRGLKKKLRREDIAAKRRRRMLNRGIDLNKINLQLKQIVVEGLDMFLFQPMHSHDRSQVRKLAAIYRLKSSCQGSGKKRLVMVMRTEHTCMPSEMDEIRLVKLVGVEDDGLMGAETGSRHVRSGGSSSSRTRIKSASREPRSLDRRPIAFVSSGVVQCDDVVVTEPSSSPGPGLQSSTGVVSYGAFESHTKGFGSRMMAKMGFVGGEGLGKDRQGVIDPITVVRRPRLLGLGANG